ncbi:MAG TPA: SIS domain-containing protein [Acidimicrobiales bacterium]|nr:SIS domain-containing protein [Acidimicrobiales bacterium]
MTDFLYPFLERTEDDAAALLADLAASARAKTAASVALRDDTLRRLDDELTRTAAAMRARVAAGGRLLVFGNGGSATDAAGFVALLRPLPALCLTDDDAVITALANDVGFDVVFARTLRAVGRAEDIAVGFSTSGGSRNVLAAFETAGAMGMLTVGIAGYGGGELPGAVDHCLEVASDSVHRIQETQNAVAYELWRRLMR